MKIVFTSVFFLASFILTAQGTHSEKIFTKEIELTTSIEETWRLLSDVSMWKQWDSHIIDARLNEDFVANAKGSLVTANAKIVNFSIVDLVEGKSYTVRHKLSSGTLYLKRTVAATGAGATVIAEVWFKGLSSKNFKKYMGKDYNGVLEKELQSLQQLLQN